MTALTSATPAARALRQADSGIGHWLSDLVTGAGSSPSHIIITGILGVVPGVGQAMDARDLVLGLIAIAKSPAAIGGWVELAITLIGCVPAVGDALKVGFKLMKQGHNFGRVLEAVSPALRGNVEKFMRKVDWTMLAAESKGLFTKTVMAFIEGLDSWVMKALAGGTTVKQLVAELKALQRRGPQMIDAAFAELKTMHAKMMGHELPGTTAAAAATSSKSAAALARREVEAARTQRRLPASKSRDIKANRVTPNATKNSVKKKGAPKGRPSGSGVPAEHITDYQVRKKHANFREANNGGKLIEEHSLPHNGLDHLWSNKTHVTKPFVVGETKSSLFDSFKLLAALPKEMQEQFAALRADEAANPTPNNGKPNIFESDGRDAHANKRVSVGSSHSHDDAVRRGVNKPNDETKLATQMSHAWILKCIDHERSLTESGLSIKQLIKDYRQGEIPCPYQRWISLVTGRQLHIHKKSGGAAHEVQIILNLPDNILDR
ncbi:hypothetical protein [Massilia sp. S19_KUP03_FR1]|uniref:hypothetical protein n=1 Tax=Massilia sp. S19_KUP03_FR1 TaxID=3025503 RepID=UPI002FCDA59F